MRITDANGKVVMETGTMGCDIHIYSETRKAGTWSCDQSDAVTREGEGADMYLTIGDLEGQDNRDYWLFGFLNTGVRTTWAWGFPYKDVFPTDASDLLAKLKTQEGEDAHSANFYTRAELLAKHEELKLKRAEFLIAPPVQGNWMEALAYHMTKLESLISSLDADVSPDDQRLVFWFDN